MNGTNPFALFLILLLLILVFDQDNEEKLVWMQQRLQKISGACQHLKNYSGELQQEVNRFLGFNFFL